MAEEGRGTEAVERWGQRRCGVFGAIVGGRVVWEGGPLPPLTVPQSLLLLAVLEIRGLLLALPSVLLGEPPLLL